MDLSGREDKALVEEAEGRNRNNKSAATNDQNSSVGWLGSCI